MHGEYNVKYSAISSLTSIIWTSEDKFTFHPPDICQHSVAGLLACGDDRGALWLYSLKEVLQKKEHKTEVQPMAILDWPDITDLNLDRNRKLRLDVYDIVVDSVAVSCTGRYLVAVTNNNMVCIWKQMEQMRSWNKYLMLHVLCLQSLCCTHIAQQYAKNVINFHWPTFTPHKWISHVQCLT